MSLCVDKGTCTAGIVPECRRINQNMSKRQNMSSDAQNHERKTVPPALDSARTFCRRNLPGACSTVFIKKDCTSVLLAAKPNGRVPQNVCAVPRTIFCANFLTTRWKRRSIRHRDNIVKEPSSCGARRSLSSVQYAKLIRPR